jgi:hypothetical protein
MLAHGNECGSQLRQIFSDFAALPQRRLTPSIQAIKNRADHVILADVLGGFLVPFGKVVDERP